ncbi:MAG TPA: HD domain-containing phosphohydrolase [Phycisphaerae bacterium]|nr:HD domain-containing phosphohydrolase [Phycisphaerae bacterium]
MKRRTISAALTSAPAAWVRGVDNARRTSPASPRPWPIGIRPTPLTFDDQCASEARRQVEEIRQELSRTRRRLRNFQLDMVTTLVAAVEAKDLHAGRHSANVAFYADRLIRPFRLSVRQVDVIRTAAILHDVGKIGIPDAILTKPGPLSPDEWQVVKQHPLTGAAILRSAACLQRELPMVLHHHEWYEGGGYPDGLCGEKIPFGARILQVADAIDAMFSPRSYKCSYSVDRVCSELLHGRGVQFDPVVADVAVSWLNRSPGEVTAPPPARKFQTMQHRR